MQKLYILIGTFLLFSSIHESYQLTCFVCNSAVKDCFQGGECADALPSDKDCYDMDSNPDAGKKDCQKDYVKELERLSKLLGARDTKWKTHIKNAFPHYIKSYKHFQIFDPEFSNTNTGKNLVCFTTTVHFPNEGKQKTDAIENDPFVLRGCAKMEEQRYDNGIKAKPQYSSSCLYHTFEGVVMETCFCNKKDDCNDENTEGNSNTIFPSFGLILVIGVCLACISLN